MIFSSQGLIGHGTICYLTQRDDEEYSIKYHWILGSKEDILNKVSMLQATQDICGVPQLIKHWLVKIRPGEVNEI